MSERLELLATAGALDPIDVHLARTLAELAGALPEAVLLAVALVSRATRDGHSCLRLDRLVSTPLLDAEGRALQLELPLVTELNALLTASPVVSDGSRPTPLVLEGQRLYLRRYWRLERALAAALMERARFVAEPSCPETARQSLAALFGPPRGRGVDGQRVAAELVALRHLTVITGGPGTGKTSTVVRVLAWLGAQARARGGFPPRTLLLAPTGKAASRLAESIHAAKAQLALEESILMGIPRQALTVHRALAAVSPRSGLAAGGVLAADVVVVDEASMVDLSLMQRLVAAVPAAARLVLLGDRHQLGSVEAGAVLADLCGPSPRRPYSPRLAAAVEDTFGESLPGAGDGPGGMADSLVELTESHRFDAGGGVGRLAAAILAGDAAGALEACRCGDVTLVPPGPDGERPGSLVARVLEGFSPYLRTSEPAAAIAALGRFRVLAAHRHGPQGFIALNRWIERELQERRLLSRSGPHYHRRPLLVTANDYELGLHNGDVGVEWCDAGDSPPRVWLATDEGSLRALGASRLPAHETVFAMSVHKSQGSEFDELLFVLPEPGSPLLTRELLYTAVTRARRRVTLVGSEASLRAAVERRAARATGLAALLWG